MSDLLIERVIELVAATFDVPTAEVTEDSSPDSLSEWNSLGQLNLVLALEQEFGIAIPEDVVLELRSVRAIAAVLRARGVGGAAT